MVQLALFFFWFGGAVMRSEDDIINKMASPYERINLSGSGL